MSKAIDLKYKHMFLSILKFKKNKNLFKKDINPEGQRGKY